MTLPFVSTSVALYVPVTLWLSREGVKRKTVVRMPTGAPLLVVINEMNFTPASLLAL
jgi:hypothetical protein